jgi:hypothetical protein
MDRRGSVIMVNAPRRAARRYNPAGTVSLGGVQVGFPEVIPGLRVPIPGVIGDVVSGALNGVVAGGVVFSGYVTSGLIVNRIVSPESAASARAAGNKFRGYWARPLLFAGTAGLFGGLAAKLAPKNKKLLWGILAASGPALRAFGGAVYALLGDSALSAPGMKGDVARLANGLSDYIQVGAFHEAGMGDEEPEEGVSDYIQVSDYVQADGMHEAGMGHEESEEEVVGI